jgi:hypothetical protein
MYQSDARACVLPAQVDNDIVLTHIADTLLLLLTVHISCAHLQNVRSETIEVAWDCFIMRKRQFKTVSEVYTQYTSVCFYRRAHEILYCLDIL